MNNVVNNIARYVVKRSFQRSGNRIGWKYLNICLLLTWLVIFSKY